MADEQREHRAKKNIYAFLQHRSIEQRRRYLARGRRFLVLDVAQLSKSWITAVNNWLARKDGASEITMDDLTAELRLRGLDPPYLTTPSNKSWPLVSPEWARPRKGKLDVRPLIRSRKYLALHWHRYLAAVGLVPLTVMAFELSAGRLRRAGGQSMGP
jgi:hypothetical protein